MADIDTATELFSPGQSWVWWTDQAPREVRGRFGHEPFKIQEVHLPKLSIKDKTGELREVPRDYLSLTRKRSRRKR